MRRRRVKDKRLFCVTKKHYRTEVELDDGEIIFSGPFTDMETAQAELARYPRDVVLYREVPQSVFIRHPQ